jgi:hypothetical protein
MSKPTPDARNRFTTTSWSLVFAAGGHAGPQSDLMDYARARLDPNRLDVRSYLARHSDEELGHDDWALDDLEHLGINRSQALSTTPLHETINLIGSQLYVITYLHPIGLLGYMYALESQPPTNDLLTFLRETFDIAPEAMSYLIRHAEEDVAHKRELEYMVNNHVLHSREREAVTISATTALADVNRWAARLRSGDYATCLPQVHAAVR